MIPSAFALVEAKPRSIEITPFACFADTAISNLNTALSLRDAKMSHSNIIGKLAAGCRPGTLRCYQ